MSTNTLFRRPSSGPEEPLPPSLHGHVTPPPHRDGAASNKASCNIENRGKQKKKRSPLRVILQSLYEEHAVSLVLFLWCGAAPEPGSDLKRLNSRLNFPPPLAKETDVSRPCKHKTARLESSKKHEGLGTLSSCTCPGIRSRPPARTPTGMVLSLPQ